MVNRTSGEVEYVIIINENKIFIGIGSDHTDRELEIASVSKAKQICPKPIGQKLWRYEDIQNHFDQIEVRSWQIVDNEEILYQEGNLSDILPVESILDAITQRVGHLENSVIFSGTVPLRSTFIYGNYFRCSL